MMSAVKAISALERIRGLIEYDYRESYQFEIDEAIEALQKQIPKEPEGAYDNLRGIKLNAGNCPECGHHVMKIEKYCPECGQKIDWY